MESPLTPRRRAATLVTVLAGLGVFTAVVHHHTPLGSWLVWRYVLFLAGDALLVAASLSLGHVVTGRVLRIVLPPAERLFFDFALGLLAFGLGIFAAGMLGVLAPALFWLWPVVALASGGPSLFRYLQGVRRHVRAASHRRRAVSKVPWLPWGVLLFGLAGALMIYVNIMTPRNVGYDARWYHFALAEHYVAAGRITRFPEGFFGGVWPHFASWLYTWAFLSKGSLFAQMELAAHVEFAVFIATLAGLPILARWMLHGRRLPLAWAAVFLFPGLFLYDSSLSGTADHVLAFWALALLLALRRLFHAFELRRALLFGCFAAAAALTKYQAANVLAFPVAAFLALAGAAAWRARRDPTAPAVSSVLATVAATGLLVVLLWAPHWVKNWVWYGDPVYPFLRGVLSGRPWVPGAFAGFSQGDWRPDGVSWSALRQSLAVLLTFSFAPHDWPRWHGALPVFGSLFTLALAPLCFLPRARRTWFVVAAVQTGVLVWFWMVHQDRHLQALLPWMAVVVAVVVHRLWQAGGGLAWAVGVLVALQVVWGGDVYFFPTHAVLWKPPVQAVVELMSAGFTKTDGDRFATGCDLEPLRGRFPPGSRLLLHESEPRLGGAVQIVTDARGAQAGIDYAAAASPAAIAALLKTMDVTHLAWRPDRSPREEQRLSNEVAFLHYAAQSKVLAREAGFVVAVPAALPLVDQPPAVVVGACAADRPVPLTELDRWATVGPEGDGEGDGEGAAPSSPPVGDMYLIDTRCGRHAGGRVPPDFQVVGRFPPYLIAAKAPGPAR